MTLIALPVYVPSAEAVPHMLSRVRAAAAKGADIIEWRVDELAGQDDALRGITELVHKSPRPSIVTARPVWEGGRFQGDDHDRFALWRQLLDSDHPPRYLDIELRAWLNHPHEQDSMRDVLHRARQTRDLHTSLVFSAHDFAGRPADLLQKVEAMTDEEACDVIKVAWRARSLRDNLEVFDLLLERRKPTIALAMGEFGLMSRVLAPKFGGFLTFATDVPESETAPGQPTIELLRDRFRFESISRETRVFGLVGWPVAHSWGPAIHNAGFGATAFDGVYLPLPVPPEYEHFKATVGALIDQPQLDFRGASVTMPHKENLLRFVAERGGRADDAAARVGAANTLIVGAAGGLECRNTDAPAIIQVLGERLGIGEAGLAGKRIAVLGAGGVARAAVAALSDVGAKIVICNRSADRAAELAAGFHGRELPTGGTAHVVVGRAGAEACGCFDIIINCTPVGMIGGPDPEGSPLPGGVALDETVTVFDTVYAPRETPLLREAKAMGATVISGADLFLRQAAFQFEAWARQAAPIEVFERAMA